MAPEQLNGADVTAKSDIYALGLVLYELFTGKRPFDAESVQQLIDLQESVHLTSMTSVAADIDPAVEKVIRRCLDPDPAKRPAGALWRSRGAAGRRSAGRGAGRRRNAVARNGRGRRHDRGHGAQVGDVLPAADRGLPARAIPIRQRRTAFFHGATGSRRRTCWRINREPSLKASATHASPPIPISGCSIARIW